MVKYIIQATLITTGVTCDIRGPLLGHLVFVKLTALRLLLIIVTFRDREVSSSTPGRGIVGQ